MDLRDTILFAHDECAGYDEHKAVVAEALAGLIARTFKVRAGTPMLRVYTMVYGIRAVPASNSEILDLLNIKE